MMIFKEGVLQARKVNGLAAKRYARSLTGAVHIINSRKARVYSYQNDTQAAANASNVFKFLNTSRGGH